MSPSACRNLFIAALDAVLELDDGVIGPEPFAYLFTADYPTRTFEQHGKDLKRLFRQADHLTAVMAQLSCPHVQYELFEPRARVPPSANLHAVPQNRVGGFTKVSMRSIEPSGIGRSYTDAASFEKTNLQTSHSKKDVLVI